MNQKGLVKNFKFITNLFFIFICNSLFANFSSDFVVTKITKNVYSIVSPYKGLPTPDNKGWNSNVHFVVTGKGVLLFDTGSSESIGNKIKKAIKTVTNKPVHWIINSHSHADHWLGNAAFKDNYVEIISSNKAYKTMKKYGEEDVKFYSKVTKGTIGSTNLLYPTVLLNKKLKRKFGDLDVEFIFSNDGHSQGDILMWLPKQKIIFGGDVLSSDWMPMIENYRNVPNLTNILLTIVNLNPKIVLTGHGKATNKDSIIRDTHFLSFIWKQVKLDFKQGKKLNKSLENIKAKLGPKYKFLYKDFSAEIQRHVNQIYKLQKT